MPPPGGQRAPIPVGVVARIAGAVKGAIDGAAEAWFGPLEPLTPAAPPETKGRAFDYPVGANITYVPRSEHGETAISFASLRALSDPTQGGLDLLRLAIETRKDQMSGQRWKLKGRDGSDGGDRARKIELALRRPDGFHTFRNWQRMLLEDLLVIDAPCIYLAPSAGDHLTPEIIDGALIKRLLRPDGRVPAPPEPAYQQVLKGVPAATYTTDELVYAWRNPRPHRIYGMSPCEQVVMSINIALRRQVSQLEYYTVGSVPDVVFGVPPTWAMEQIKSFQTWWDSILSGNTAERRRARFIPGDIKPFALKPDGLKDEFDEWLARIICYCFSLSPQALVRQMNRATAETGKQEAAEQGLEPLKLWQKDVIDEVLEKGFDAADLEFAYEDEEISDPTVKVTVISELAGKKPIITVDEARQAYGYAAATPAQLKELAPPPPVAPLGSMNVRADGPPPEEPPPEKDPSEKVAKAATRRLLRPIPRERKVVADARDALTAAAQTYLGHQLSAAKAWLRARPEMAKAEEDDGIPALVDDGGAFRSSLEDHLSVVAQDGAAQALRQLSIEVALDQVNERAVKWARQHARDLIKGIDDTTKAAIKEEVAQALEDGISNAKLAERLSESHAFSESRALTIARTESAYADVIGNIEGWKESGVVAGKRWIVGDGACDECAILEGVVVALDDEFPDPGGEGPPAHPRCRCDVSGVLAPEEDVEG